MTYINFNRHNSKLFAKEYNKAVKENKSEFTWQSNEYLTTYAYYLIQYLVMQKMIEGDFENKIFIIK